MNTSGQILIIDVNVIIHLEKAGLLDKLICDKNVRIVDLVLYEEYQYKKNLISDKVAKIKQLQLTEAQVAEAHKLYLANKRNGVFDYYSYVVARDNGFALLTGDWKLKKVISNDVETHGAIWYVQHLRNNNIISDDDLVKAYETWLNDPMVFMPEDVLTELILQLKTESNEEI